MLKTVQQLYTMYCVLHRMHRISRETRRGAESYASISIPVTSSLVSAVSLFDLNDRLCLLILICLSPAHSIKQEIFALLIFIFVLLILRKTLARKIYFNHQKNFFIEFDTLDQKFFIPSKNDFFFCFRWVQCSNWFLDKKLVSARYKVDFTKLKW